MNSAASSLPTIIDNKETNESITNNTNGQADDKNIIDKILGEMKCQFNKTERKSSNNNNDDDDDDDDEEKETEGGGGGGDDDDDDDEINDNKSSLNNNNNNNSNDDEDDNKTENIDKNHELNNKTDNSTNNDDGDDNKDKDEDGEKEEKPRIVLLFKKPNTEITPVKCTTNNSSNRRSLRNQKNPINNEKTIIKRSTRRRSKDCTESILQSAIARKEKSYNESNNKPQRLTRQLKPTQKILENLEIAKQEKTKSRNHNKVADKTRQNNDDTTDEQQQYRKHKRNNKKTTTKRLKNSNNDNNNTSSKESDSDQSMELDNRSGNVGGGGGGGAGFRRSRRISSRYKEETSMDTDDAVDSGTTITTIEETSSSFLNNVENSNNHDLITSKLCLCTQKTQYYVAPKPEETLYCCAIDSVDDKTLGCSRVIETNQDIMMLRPSTRIPYSYYCESHKNRLLRHNCCPTCGIFCTQGRFIECESKHQYHKNCKLIIGNTECCPHCGITTTTTTQYDINITMHTIKKPIFLPMQKTQYVTAKITYQNTFNNNNKNEDTTINYNNYIQTILPIGIFNLLNNTELLYTDDIYNINDIIVAIKNKQLEKLATMLGTKSIDLCAKIPELNDGTLLHLAVQNSTLPIVHMLLIAGLQHDVYDKDQNTPLMLAILADNNDIVEYLIKTGSTIDLKGIDGMTALHLSAKCGNIKACELLLKSSSSQQNHRNFINCLDDGGWTPLVWACENGYKNIVNFLLYKGADASIRDVEHNVALHWATFSGNLHIIELLLNNGCEINAINAHGDTPLHIGARQDLYDCVLMLLARGADVHILNKNNELPLDCVPSDGNCYGPLSLNTTLQAITEYEHQSVLLTNDMSKGKELNPIQCYNSIDHEPKPSDFIYITKNCVTLDDIKIDTKITSLQSCNCDQRCIDDDCNCGNLSVRCWYDEDGKLVPDFNFNDIPMIFECNDGCTCNTITCNNRIVQKGLNYRFEIFKTPKKGWGIRTLRTINKGSFVCEYIGEIITDLEADKRDDDSYLFDLENRVYKSISDADSYCIDAKFYGNFARFINHSCAPNLTSVKVFVDHQDLRFPRIAFFANREITANEELSFDYGEKFWMAKYKTLSCLCDSDQCKYSQDVINDTLETYQRCLLEECG